MALPISLEARLPCLRLANLLESLPSTRGAT
jgi:hypothetical protein